MPVSIKGYYKPTPAKVRKIADSISAAIKVIGASSIVASSPILGLAFLIAGESVKVISNFFIDDDKTNQ